MMPGRVKLRGIANLLACDTLECPKVVNSVPEKISLNVYCNQTQSKSLVAISSANCNHVKVYTKVRLN